MNIVVILGNKLEKPELHLELKGRMDVGIKVFKEKSGKYMILSGGKSNPLVKFSECELMKAYAIQNGISKNSIILDYNSLDTIGNAYFTRKIIDRIEDNISTVFIISSCYHMKRVKFIFEKVYGHSYNLNFKYCFQIENPEAQIKEKNSLRLAKEFFKGIKAGDMKEIEMRIYTIHNLYSKGKLQP